MTEEEKMEVVNQNFLELQISPAVGVVSDVAANSVPVEKENSVKEVEVVDLPLTKYLLPVYREYLKLDANATDEDSSVQEDFQVPVKLKENIFQFIWGPDLFRMDRSALKRIYNDISGKLTVSLDQSDLDDMLQYHPTEVVSSKFIQVMVAMAMVEPVVATKDIIYLEELFEDEKLNVDSSAIEAYKFLLHSVKALFNILTGRGEQDLEAASVEKNNITTDYQDLNRESKGVIKGLSALYMKAFRVKPNERYDKMQSVTTIMSGSVEWILYVIEMLRMRRRDGVKTKSKRPTQYESDLVEQSLLMERDNPFVRWNLIDCVIDALRESNGRFHCGDILHLYDTNQAMQFLRDECMKLCEDFPKNVTFLSAVSDYFARYVPYVYFDKTLSDKLLMDAYRLNPNNPKTTHRLGIFNRMNLKNGQESVKWLEKSLELDPTHFNANMDYYKTLLGKPDIYKGIGAKMEEKLKSATNLCWRNLEKIDFQFYTGLAYFAEGRKDDALSHWMEVMKISESLFSLCDVDSDGSFFSWDCKFISTDKIREWIQDELQKTKKNGNEATEYDPEKKKCIERMFYLMLGIIAPKRQDPYDGPYTEIFKYRLVE